MATVATICHSKPSDLYKIQSNSDGLVLQMVATFAIWVYNTLLVRLFCFYFCSFSPKHLTVYTMPICRQLTTNTMMTWIVVVGVGAFNYYYKVRYFRNFHIQIISNFELDPALIFPSGANIQRLVLFYQYWQWFELVDYDVLNFTARIEILRLIINLASESYVVFCQGNQFFELIDDLNFAVRIEKGESRNYEHSIIALHRPPPPR